MPFTERPRTAQQDTICIGQQILVNGQELNTHVAGHLYATDTTVDTCAPFNWNGEEYTISGTYTQTFQTQYGCDSTIVLNLTILPGIDQGVGQSAIMLYPNPTQGVLHFSQPIESAVVYDAQGRQVLTLSNTDHADLGQLPSGIYTLRITTPEGCATRRLCIE